jgi:hypothetical protein
MTINNNASEIVAVCPEQIGIALLSFVLQFYIRQQRKLSYRSQRKLFYRLAIEVFGWPCSNQTRCNVGLGLSGFIP